MPLVREHGRLENGSECEHPSPCNEKAVARVPNPVEITAAGLDLCPFHLALWADTRGEEATLRELDVADLATSDRWLTLDAAPPQLDRDVVWHRLGVDHRGLAHYYQLADEHEGADRIATVNRTLDIVGIYNLPARTTLNLWIEDIAERRGWVALEDNPVEDPSEAVPQ